MRKTADDLLGQAHKTKPTAMNGWKDLLGHLRAVGLPLHELSDRQIALTARTRIAPRTVVIVTLLEVDGVEWVELTIIVGPKLSMPPGDALAKNVTVLHGALCVQGAHYRLRCTHALAYTTRESFVFYLEKFAAQAADLQQEARQADS